jgi:hypothetical protein
VRNLKVATATGVKPSRIASLTTTKELPQKTIKHDIKKASTLLIALTPISLLPSTTLKSRLFNA